MNTLHVEAAAFMASALTESSYRAFVLRLIALRRQAGLTQRELAARLGRQQSYVNKTERFERRIDPSEFMTIVRALGFDPVEEFGVVVAELSKEGAED